jgi:hypothetical protein
LEKCTFVELLIFHRFSCGESDAVAWSFATIPP